MSYFIDTANLDELKIIEDKLDLQQPKSVAAAFLRGITTNPNAINKVGVTTMDELQRHLMKLSDWLYNVPAFLNTPRLIYVQHPDSKATIQEITKFADVLRRISKSNLKNVQFGLKIHPDRVHESVELFDLHLNVTGLASSTQAIPCCCEWIKYVSIIPGRMEEAGLDANNHLFDLMRNRNITEVITGSMRTIAGVESAIKYGTVPTIGFKVFNQFENSQHFEDMFSSDLVALACSRDKTAKGDELSKAFFAQMDAAGEVFARNLRANHET